MKAKYVNFLNNKTEKLAMLNMQIFKIIRQKISNDSKIIRGKSKNSTQITQLPNLILEYVNIPGCCHRPIKGNIITIIYMV